MKRKPKAQAPAKGQAQPDLLDNVEKKSAEKTAAPESEKATPEYKAPLDPAAAKVIENHPRIIPMFLVLKTLLVDCVAWDVLDSVVEFLMKLLAGMRERYAPKTLPADPWPMEKYFDMAALPRPYNEKKEKYYSPDGKEIKSVTGILGSLGWNKNALIAWARKEAMTGHDPFDRRDAAADAGKVCHYLIECFVHRKRPEIEKIKPFLLIQAKIKFNSFIAWYERDKPQFIKSEVRLTCYCEIDGAMYFYGGTIDLVAVLNGEMCLVDFKTGKGVYADHIIQVAAYLTAVKQNGYNIGMGAVKILHIPQQEGEPVNLIPIPHEDLNTGWQVFRHLIPIAYLQEELEK
jgi:hypothetical protein